MFLFRELMMQQTTRFKMDQALRQWLTGKKRGEDRNTKIWISREWKIADTSFKHLNQFNRKKSGSEHRTPGLGI